MAHPRDPTRELLREISRDVRGDLRGISGKENKTFFKYNDNDETILKKFGNFILNLVLKVD